MTKLQAQDEHAQMVRQAFAACDGLEHLRVRRRADLLVVESGEVDDPIPHARFRRLAGQVWVLEMATHTGRWQPSGERGLLEELAHMLIHDFGWTLTRIV
jgi:hypothetical protein